MSSSEVTENETHPSCLQSSILSQGTLACQELLICLGVNTITLSVSDTPLPHVKKGKVGRWRGEKRGYPFLFQLRSGGPQVGERCFSAVAAAPPTPKPTDTSHSLLPCRAGTVATLSSFADTGCVRPRLLCILARKCRRA